MDFVTIFDIKYAPLVFIGTIGHVAHGKSTIVKAVSGVQTVRFKNELERNITIKLGKYYYFIVLAPYTIVTY